VEGCGHFLIWDNECAFMLEKLRKLHDTLSTDHDLKQGPHNAEVL
jgi:hypothetical protein